ncbi:MAG TPA: DUF456 domain-containing protein [Thermoflexia bacterium]|nr:DUF456 domain-containing protein [Thermoflexia bacterium]
MVLPAWAFWVALVVMLIGLVGTVVPILPDVVLIWLTALVYAIAEGFSTIDPLTFAALTVLAAIGVTTEIWVSQLGGKLGGASWQALLAGMGLGAVGFVVGLLVGGIGALPAALIGALSGVMLVEYLRRRDWKETARAGAGWLAGCLVSGGIKLLVGLAMILLFVWQVTRG